MSEEGLKPSAEDIKTTEEMMSKKQRNLSEERESTMKPIDSFPEGRFKSFIKRCRAGNERCRLEFGTDYYENLRHAVCEKLSLDYYDWDLLGFADANDANSVIYNIVGDIDSNIMLWDQLKNDGRLNPEESEFLKKFIEISDLIRQEIKI